MDNAGHVFVSYAHHDRAVVAAEIARLEELGYRVWHDRDITPATEWADEIASAIESAGVVVFFATPRAVRSEHCRREISFAISIEKPFLAVHLEPTSLQGGVALSLGTQQAIVRWNLPPSSYEKRIGEALDRLLSPESRVAPKRPRASAHRGFSVAQRRIWSVPFPRNANFTGRGALLERIEAELSPANPHRVIALTGLGGVGKTQLALEIAQRNRHDFDLVAWLAAEEPEHLAGEIAALSDSLGLVDASIDSTETRISALIAFLDASERWLLIFDNAPDPAAIARYLPKHGAGKTLVTTRYQFWGNLARRISVGVLEAYEATEFITRRTGQPADEPVRRLVEELGCLPLALECAASYIEATGRDAKSYLSLFHTHRDRLFEQLTAGADYPATLPTTWNISLRLVAATSPPALELFHLLAFLGPDGIPIHVIRPGLAALEGTLSRLAHDDLFLDESISALTRFSFISIEAGLVTMHRLVQLIARTRNEEARKVAACALRVIESVFPRSGLEGDTRAESARLYPHAVAVLDHCRDFEECRTTSAQLLRRTGSYLSARGRHREGAEQLRRAIEIFEQTGEFDSARFARTLGSLGLVEYALGHTREAHERLAKAVEIYERLYGEDLHVAQELIGFCWVLRTEGRLADADSHIDRSIRIAERLLGGASPIVAMPLSAKARIAYDRNQLVVAAQSAARCRDLLASGGSPEHPLMTGTYNNLAQVFLDLGELDAAEVCVARGLAIGLRGYGEDHPLTAIAFGLRGSLARIRGDGPQAVEWLSKCLRSGANGSIKLHEDVARRRAELGLCFLADDDVSAAREQVFTALAELEYLCGAPNRVDGLARAALAEVLLREGDLDGAATASAVAVESLAEFFGARHPISLPAMRSLGCALFRRGATAEARRILEQALAIGLEQPRPTYEVGLLEAALAEVLEREDASSALAHLRRSLTVLRSTLGSEHPSTMAVLAQLTAGG